MCSYAPAQPVSDSEFWCWVLGRGTFQIAAPRAPASSCKKTLHPPFTAICCVHLPVIHHMRGPLFSGLCTPFTIGSLQHWRLQQLSPLPRCLQQTLGQAPAPLSQDVCLMFRPLRMIHFQLQALSHTQVKKQHFRPFVPPPVTEIISCQHRILTKAWHCVRAAKEMDPQSIGLCPQVFESPRCRCGLWAQQKNHMGMGWGGSNDARPLQGIAAASHEWLASQSQAAIAQLRERQTEDLKVPGLIPGLGKFFTAFLHPKVLYTRSKVQMREQQDMQSAAPSSVGRVQGP